MPYGLKYTLCILAAACLASCLSPHSAPTFSEKGGPAPMWPQDHSDLTPDPALTFGRLENGMRYVLMNNRTPTDRVSMHLNIQSGSLHEADDQQGLAHFLEHMVFNGSTHFPPGELVKYFQRIGMDFGPDANAHTSFRETVYDISLPKGDPRSLDEGLTVMADYAAGAFLLPAEVERESKVILAEKRSRDSAGYRTFIASIQFELPDHRMSRRMPIGQAEVIEKADSDLLRSYYETWYRPERMVIVMVGDFDIPTAESLIRERLGGIQARRPALPEPDMGVIRHAGIQTFHHYEAESGNTEVTLQVLTDAPRTADTAEQRRKNLVQDLAHAIIQNRLDRITRQSDAPFTRGSAEAGVFLDMVGYAALSAECQPDRWEISLATLEQNLRQALLFGFKQEELDRVRQDYLAELQKAVETAATRESTVLSREIVQSINADEVHLSPAQEKALIEPMLRDLTPETVHAALKQSWAPDHRLVMVTGNAAIGSANEPAEPIVARALDKSRQVAVMPPEHAENPAFPYLKTPEAPAPIISRKDIADLGIVQAAFANGVRVNIRRTGFKKNDIQANLVFGQGRKGEPADRPGLGELSQAIINESGLGRMDRETLEQALAGKSTSVDFSVNTGHMSLTGKTVPREVELMFQLFQAHLLDPACRPEAFDQSVKRFGQMYEEMSRSVEGAIPLTGQRFLAGGDSRFGMPSRSDLDRLTLADVKNWVLPAIANEPIEISIVGDLDVDAILSLSARYLGTLPKRVGVSRPQRPDRLTFPSGQRLDIDVNTRIEKGSVYVTFPTDDIYDIRRTRRLAILANVFSDRLREIIREKLGATYSPYAFNAPSRDYPGYGYFQSVVSINPQDADTVIRETQNIAADLARNGITQDELRRALDPTLNSIKDLRQENQYWLETVLTGSSDHPEQIEWARTIESDYAAITAKDVADMAARYRANDRAAVITGTPAEGAAKADGAPAKC